jgi:hypothetical protein
MGTVHHAGFKRRWRLLDTAGDLLNDKVPRINKAGQEVAHYVYRQPMCQRGMDGGGVTLRRSLDGQRAEFVGVQTCGSWHCPMCGPKIAARHVEQLNLAMAAWTVQGGGLYIITYTNQHGKESAGQGECAAAMDRLGGALSNYKGRRSYLNFRRDRGVVGVVRALETNYGELNGFHHHTHEIMFADAGLLVLDRNEKPVRWLSPLYRLGKAWARVLIKKGLAGLKPGDVGAEKFKKLRSLLRRCFDARDGRFAAEYVVKLGKEPEAWGLASELAKSHLKNGGQRRPDQPRRCDHANTWELLNDAADGDARSGELWREWFIAMRGRAKLYWSKGLKALFNIPDVDDIELARRPDAQCIEAVCTFGPWEWKLIQTRRARCEILLAGATGGELAVRKLLLALAARPPGHDGDFDIVNRDPQFYTVLGDGRKYWDLPKGGR